MENQSAAFTEATIDGHPQIALINTFCEITACASKSEALFFLESHNFDLDAAVSTFLDDAHPDVAAAAVNPAALSNNQLSPSESLSASPRSRSPSPPRASRSYNLRAAKPSTGASASGGTRRGGGIRTFADLNRKPKDGDSDSDSDFDPQEYYTGGEKSGMLVQGPSKAKDVDAIFNQARQSGGVEASTEHHVPSSSSRRFAGTGRLLSGEVSSTPTPTPTPQQPEVVNHNITFWRNGFTVDDGPLRRLDDPANASFLESVMKSECPKELAPADKRNAVHVNLIRKEEEYKEPERPRLPFQGVGRTLGSTSETAPTEPTSGMTSAPAPSPGLVVDQTQSCTSIQLRLADGTRMVSRFNNYHTIRDIRGFIDASRPGGPTSYQLQTMGFPPQQLTNLDQTIDEAGIANSVVIQKL
ncbi:hypothetical protein ACS0TY_017621 [Phlomoides rotata]